MPRLSTRPSPPRNASPGVAPSHSPVTMKVSRLPTSPGSSTVLLSLPWILVSPLQSLAQNSFLAPWKRAREERTLAVQATSLVIAALTLWSSYKVCAHMHTHIVCVCSCRWKFRTWFIVHKHCVVVCSMQLASFSGWVGPGNEASMQHLQNNCYTCS